MPVWKGLSHTVVFPKTGYNWSPPMQSFEYNKWIIEIRLKCVLHNNYYKSEQHKNIKPRR